MLTENEAEELYVAYLLMKEREGDLEDREAHDQGTQTDYQQIRAGVDAMMEPAIFGTHDEKTLAQLRDVASRDEWLGHKGVILRGGGLDEAPQAYRRLPEVLAAQGDTIKVLHTLTPLIVVMAGENEYDLYKD